MTTWIAVIQYIHLLIPTTNPEILHYIHESIPEKNITVSYTHLTLPTNREV